MRDRTCEIYIEKTLKYGLEKCAAHRKRLQSELSFLVQDALNNRNTK